MNRKNQINIWSILIAVMAVFTFVALGSGAYDRKDFL